MGGGDWVGGGGWGRGPSAAGGGIVARPPVCTFQQASGWACIRGSTCVAVAAVHARPDDGGAAVGAEVSMHGTALLPVRLPDAGGRVSVRPTVVGRQRSALARTILHRAAPFGTSPRRRWRGPGLTSSGLPRPASPHVAWWWVSFLRLAFMPLLGCPLPISRRICFWPLWECVPARSSATRVGGVADEHRHAYVMLWPKPQLG